MTDTTTPAGADDRGSARKVAKAFIRDMSLMDTLDETTDALHALIEDRELAAVTPALARHQQAVDELWALLNDHYDCCSSERMYSRWEARRDAALAAHRPLVSQSPAPPPPPDPNTLEGDEHQRQRVSQSQEKK